MSRIRVVVTGLGATTPLGGDVTHDVGRPAGRQVRRRQDRVPTGLMICPSRSRHRQPSIPPRSWNGSRRAGSTAAHSWRWSPPWRPGRTPDMGSVRTTLSTASASASLSPPASAG